MTNGSNNRLNRIEDDLETVKDILIAVARRAEATDERLDRLISRQDRTQEQLDQLAVAHDRTQNQLEQLSERFDRFTEYMESSQASINASIERQDRIMDYLMRRERDGNGDGPQV